MKVARYLTSKELRGMLAYHLDVLAHIEDQPGCISVLTDFSIRESTSWKALSSFHHFHAVLVPYSQVSVTRAAKTKETKFKPLPRGDQGLAIFQGVVRC